MGRIILRCRNCNSEIAFPVTAVREGVTCPGCARPVPLRMDPALEERRVVRHGGEVAVDAGDLDAGRRQGRQLALGADQLELQRVGHQAASAAMRSAFFTTSSMPPTM